MTAAARPDPRPGWLRALVASGLPIGTVAGVGMVAESVASLDQPGRRFGLCVGLLVLVGVAAGAAREVAERRIARTPPQPRPGTLPDGEQALLLPRATAPTRISSLALVGFAAVTALGAVLAAVGHGWGLALVLTLVAGWLVLVAAPARVTAMAGGLWLTPTRIVDDHRGIRWEVRWEDVTGVDVGQPSRVLVAVRRDRAPSIRRTGPRGRAWNPVRARNVLIVDAAHLAGGSALAGSLIRTALADPGSRRSLGAP